MDQFNISPTGRERTSMGLVLLVLLVLAIGLFKLQVIAHSELNEKSEHNRIRVVPLVPRRGLVFDREGRVIIANRPSYTLSIVAAEEISGVTLPNLSQIISMDTTEIRKRMRRNMVSRYQPTPIKTDIPFEVVAILEEQAQRFPGVTYQAERVRLYRDSLGVETFTGYVGEASPADLKNRKSHNYRLGTTIGKEGLEKRADELLRGKEGTAYIEVFASGQILGPYKDRPPVKAVSGEDITLTIDIDIQRACMDAIDTFCCGAIVAIDPRDGGILAMVSFPSYNANIFSSVISDTLWNRIRSDTNHPLLNRPIDGLYPPGSTTKFITVGAGMELDLINENSTFEPCLGGMQFGNRYFRCWKVGGHGVLNGVHSLEQSCDVYMYQLGLKMGVDNFSDFFGQCGFGTKTGIDLPDEKAGLNPNSKYYDGRYGSGKWSRALILNNAIGQGEILVTPLQLTQFFCGLANKGKVYEPHLILKRVSADGVEYVTTPKISFELPFSPKVMDYLYEGMRLVVEGKDGTAYRLRNDDYSIGGKTGTAQNPHGENHSLFVGVAPLDAPEIVVCAIIENGGHGSDVAAPAVGRIIKAYMTKRNSLKDPISLLSEQEN